MLKIISGLASALFTLRRNLARLEDQAVQAAIRRRPIVQALIEAACSREAEIRSLDYEGYASGDGNDALRAFWRAKDAALYEFDHSNQPEVVTAIDALEQSLQVFYACNHDLVIARLEGAAGDRYDPWRASVQAFYEALSNLTNATTPYLSTAQTGPTSEPLWVKIKRLTGYGHEQVKLIGASKAAPRLTAE